MNKFCGYLILRLPQSAIISKRGWGENQVLRRDMNSHVQSDAKPQQSINKSINQSINESVNHMKKRVFRTLLLIPLINGMGLEVID